MRAMVLNKPKRPLELRDVAKPKPGRGQLLVRVSSCAICRTDLHVVDGELPEPKLPLIPGHQIVGQVEEIGEEMWEEPERPDSRSTKAAPTFEIGDRVGIPWLGWTDGDYGRMTSAFQFATAFSFLGADPYRQDTGPGAASMASGRSDQRA